MQRAFFMHDGLRFSYLDGGGAGPPLVFLHAHWMGASDFAPVLPAFAGAWRVLALDQRGHGETDHGGAHSIAAYVSDVDALLAHVGVTRPVVLLGHSFGGQVANLYAAARPERVRALVLEDIDVARDDRSEMILAWAGVFPTRDALLARIGPPLAPYLAASIRRTDDGWTLRFDPHEVLRSEAALNGDHWDAWLAHRCPALLVRGARSRVVAGEALEAMARRRPHTTLVTLDAGHAVHVDDPASFVAVVRHFLHTLPPVSSTPPAG